MRITAFRQQPSTRLSATVGGWSGNRWTSVKLHAAVVVMVALSLPILENPGVTLIIGGVLCTITYLALGLLEMRRAPLRLSPLSFYFLWYIVGLGLSAIYVGSIIVSGAYISFAYPPQVPPSEVVAGYMIYLVGSLALHVGLQCFRPTGREARAIGGRDLGTRRLGWLVALWVIGLWTIWYPEWIAPIGAPGRMLQWASMAALSAFILTPRERFGLSRMSFCMLLVIGTGGLFAANLMAYSKAYLMLSFLPVIWLFIIRPALQRWLPILGLAMIVLYLLIVAPVVTIARYTPLAPGESPAEHLINMFQTWQTVAIDATERAFYDDQVIQFLRRQFDPIALGYLVGEVKTHGLQYGATMAYAAYAFIPRILWPEKPVVTRGAWFAYYVGFASSEEESTMSLGISATGELYWNYGIPGALIGMFTIGALSGGLWRMAGTDPRRSPLHMLLYILTLISMINMSEAVTTFLYITVVFITFKTAFFAANLIAPQARRTYVAIPS